MLFSPRRPIPLILPAWMPEFARKSSANMRAVDTNVLVRLIVRDDPGHVAAAEDFVAPGAWVSLLVLAETASVLESVYGLGRRRIATVVGMLLEHERITLQDEGAVRRAQAAFKRETAADFSDCLILEAARKAGHVPLGTFDKALARLEGARQL